MHLIHTNKISYLDDGTHDYVFECVQPTSQFSEVSDYVYLDNLENPRVQLDISHLSEVQREIYMWRLFETYIIPRIQAGQMLHLNGTFTKKIYDYIRNIYQSAGYFQDSHNRFQVPSTAQITLGITLSNLNYQPQNKPLVYLSQGAIRANIAALNDGCIARIYAQPEDGQEITIYLQQSHVQLARLSMALSFGWQMVSPNALSSFTLRAHAPSWNEALNE
ncbi:MAG: hypothetical protein PHU93_00615 [Candidatus Gracilibacteria bacterium]|nr:hypothetical protein [Candidatus Gracilibacteria bacterium]